MNLSLALEDVSKSFGSVRANEHVTFAVEKGSIHGLVGENGAGKSTIMKLVYGLYAPHSGKISVNGLERKIDSPRTARALGIGMVQQHFTFVPTLSVWENVILGSEPSLLNLPKQRLISELDVLQKSFGFSLPMEATIEALGVGLQQQVEILKILYQQANILIFDEPTAVLTPQEVSVFFNRLRMLHKSGKTLILITHKLKEILAFTQRVTVMRQGRVIETRNTVGLTEEELAEKIIGRKSAILPNRTRVKDAPVILKLDNICGHTLNNLSLTVHSGEILGIAGIEGNGQHELCEILGQVSHGYSGTVTLLGREITALSRRPSAVYTSKQSGLSVIPPDRHAEGVILDFTVEENAILGHHHESPFAHGLRFSFKKRLEWVTSLLKQFDVRPNDPTLPMHALSGGNQQKLVVARETFRVPRLLVASHPTRGVDIGAIEFIHSHFLHLRENGTGTVLISSELGEILALSDRILVLFQGRIVGETTPQMATETQLGLWMTGAVT